MVSELYKRVSVKSKKKAQRAGLLIGRAMEIHRSLRVLPFSGIKNLLFVKVKLNTKHADFLATFLYELRPEIVLIGLDFRTAINLAAEVMIF